MPNNILQQAVQAHQKGQIDQAEVLYKKVLESAPDDPNANNLLGTLCHQKGELDQAILLIKRAIKAAPNESNLHFSLASVLKAKGDNSAAMVSLNESLRCDQKNVKAWFNLANICAETGANEDAIRAYENCMTLMPGLADAPYNLGILFLKTRQHERAIEYFQRALQINPKLVGAYQNMGHALKSQKNAEAALRCYLKAFELSPTDLGIIRNLALLLNNSQVSITDEVFLESLKRALIACLNLDNIEHQHFFAVSLGLLFDSKRQSAIESFIESDSAHRAELLSSTEITALMTEELFLLILKRCLNIDETLEAFLQALRSAFTQAYAKGELNESAFPVLAALATQCFWSEYIWNVSTDEEALIEVLKSELDQELGAAKQISAEKILLLACYVPLHALPAAEGLLSHLSSRSNDDYMEGMIRVVLAEPLQEKQIAQSLPVLSSLENAVSESVRSQYEEHPYPRWIGTFWNPPEPFLLNVQREIAPNQLPPAIFNQPTWRNVDVLIAGGGTGRQPISKAKSYANSQVLAVDLSFASLSYAQRKAKQLNVDNLSFMQADILCLEQLNRQFDVIESSGVLHHMEDPVVGWKVLLSCLKPGGFMKIALYSEMARKGVVETRELIAEQAFPSTIEGIRQCREAMRAQSETSAIKTLCQAEDFYSASMMRDLVFHVQEHRYTLPQIAEITDQLGLAFLGFTISAEEKARYIARFPEDPSCTDFNNWHVLEQETPNMFSAMYQMWFRKP